MAVGDAEQVTPPGAEEGNVSLVRNVAFQLFWLSRFISSVGKEAADVAYPLLILATTHSAAYASAVGSIELAVAGLAATTGGSLSDRVDRRLLFMGCDIARMVMLALFSVLVLRHQSPMLVVFAIVIASSICLGISDTPVVAAVKYLVPPSQLTKATTQTQVRALAATVVGSPLASALFEAARALPFLVTTGAFACSALLLAPIKKPMQAARAARTRSGDPRDGIRFLVREPVLLGWIIWIMGSNMAFNHVGAFVALIATAKQRHASGADISLMLGIAGAGGVVGALIAGRAIRRLKPATIFLIAAWCGPVAAVLLVFVPGSVSLGIILGAVFVRGPAVNALFYTYLAVLVPDALQGRVLGAATALSYISQPIGILGVGIIFDAGGPQWTFVFIGVVSTLAALPTLARRIRAMPDPADVIHAARSDPPAASGPASPASS